MRAQLVSDLWRWWTGALPGRICSQVEASQSAGSGMEQGRRSSHYLLLSVFLLALQGFWASQQVQIIITHLCSI